LLLYSRVDTKGKEFVPTDCSEIVAIALANLRVSIGEASAVVDCDQLPVVGADKSQLLQVFQNLIGNAIKFRSKNAPVVSVSAEDAGRNWLFSVKDNGLGFDMKYGERIFVIFQRLHTKEMYPGSGIGLAVCKKIIERHGGSIWAESEPGKGAKFSFTIPKLVEGLRVGN
jgi:light-regulated signal transduction histidine kinase (bacteriophytochrome)